MSKKKPKARSPGKLETAIQQSLSKVSVKKLVAMNIPYLIAFYVVEKCAWLYRHCIGGTVVQKLGVMLMNLPVAFRSWIPSFHIRDLLAGIIGALLLRCVVYMKGKNAKKFRQGEEYGSARWGNEKDIEPFIDPVFENNIILTQTERLTMNSRPKLPKYAAETIIGNCDTVLFLGGKESSTLKEISETLGKETIDLYNTSDTRGNNRSYGLNYQKTGKDLMSRDELAVMDGNKCILQLRGVRPFFSDKYDITKHRRYKELSDYNRKNEFDIEKYLEHKLVISRDTAFEMHEYEITKEDIAAVEAEEGERYVD